MSLKLIDYLLNITHKQKLSLSPDLNLSRICGRNTNGYGPTLTQQSTKPACAGCVLATHQSRRPPPLTVRASTYLTFIKNYNINMLTPCTRVCTFPPDLSEPQKVWGSTPPRSGGHWVRWWDDPPLVWRDVLKVRGEHVPYGYATKFVVNRPPHPTINNARYGARLKKMNTTLANPRNP